MEERGNGERRRLRKGGRVTAHERLFFRVSSLRPRSHSRELLPRPCREHKTTGERTSRPAPNLYVDHQTMRDI